MKTINLGALLEQLICGAAEAGASAPGVCQGLRCGAHVVSCPPPPPALTHSLPCSGIASLVCRLCFTEKHKKILLNGEFGFLCAVSLSHGEGGGGSFHREVPWTLLRGGDRQQLLAKRAFSVSSELAHRACSLVWSCCVIIHSGAAYSVRRRRCQWCWIPTLFPGSQQGGVRLWLCGHRLPLWGLGSGGSTASEELGSLPSAGVPVPAVKPRRGSV